MKTLVFLMCVGLLVGIFLARHKEIGVATKNTVPAQVAVAEKQYTKDEYINTKRALAGKMKNGTLDPNEVNDLRGVINYELQRCAQSTKQDNGQIYYVHEVNGDVRGFLLKLLETDC